jgi:hypothetical protein
VNISSRSGDIVRVVRTLDLDDHELGWLGGFLPNEADARTAVYALPVAPAIQPTVVSPKPVAPPETARARPDERYPSATPTARSDRALLALDRLSGRFPRRVRQTIAVAPLVVVAVTKWLFHVRWVLAVVAGLVALVAVLGALGAPSVLRRVLGRHRRIVRRSRAKPVAESGPMVGGAGADAVRLDRENVVWRAPPAAESLVPSVHMRTFATAIARVQTEGSIDMVAMIRLAAARRPIVRPPRHRRWSVGRGVQVQVQRGAAMEPFLGDSRQLTDALRSIASRHSVAILGFELNPMHVTSPLSVLGDEDSRDVAELLPRSGTPLLIVTDLGIGVARHGPFPVRPEAWLRHHAAARRAGCWPIYLVPYPVDRWPSDLRQLPAVYWHDDLRTSELASAVGLR